MAYATKEKVNAHQREYRRKRSLVDPSFVERERSYKRAWTIKRRAARSGLSSSYRARVKANQDVRATAEYREEHREKQRAWRYRAKYGIVIEQYDKMFGRQSGVCAICNKPPKRIRLSVDHDHKTGRVRGLLCSICNRRVLGRGLEDPELHESAARYLRSDFDGRTI